MSWKRFWHISGEVLFWSAIVLFFVWVGLLRNHNEEARTVRSIKVVVCDSLERRFVTPEIIMNRIQETTLDPLGESVEDINLKEINLLVESYSFVSHSRTFVDYDGNLTIEIHQREPVLRIMTSKGEDLYLSQDMYLLPVQPHTTLNLPLVTGDVPLPCEAGFTGPLADKEKMLEKKYEENYNFLCKLINFARLTEQTPAWRGKFVQFVATVDGKRSGKQSFTEPTFELIPRHGNYTIEIGTLEDTEEKLRRLEGFLQACVVDPNGGVVNVEFDNQVLWRAPKSEKKKK